MHQRTLTISTFLFLCNEIILVTIENIVIVLRNVPLRKLGINVFLSLIVFFFFFSLFLQANAKLADGVEFLMNFVAEL